MRINEPHTGRYIELSDSVDISSPPGMTLRFDDIIRLAREQRVLISVGFDPDIVDTAEPEMEITFGHGEPV